MPLQTNLNINPYFNDYDENDNYYRILFKPGYPILAKELNSLQDMILNQIETSNSLNYKNGDLVIPGNIGFNKLDVVLLQPTFNTIDIESLIDTFEDTVIVGELSGVSAKVIKVLKAKNSEKNINSLYVKYLSSGKTINNIQLTKFIDGEALLINDVSKTLTYPTESTIYKGTIASISDGIFYWNGLFVNVNEQSIITSQYNITPTINIGLEFNEKIITIEDENKLGDNSNGFLNILTKGADRLKIDSTLKTFNIKPNNVVELLKIKNGDIVYKIDKSVSYQIIDTIAKKIYDINGNFTLNDINLSLKETLKTPEKDGLYETNEITNNNKIILNREPNNNEINSINGNNYISGIISSGTAYIKGYEHIFNSPTSIEINKNNKTSNKKNVSLLLNNGIYFIVEDLDGLLDTTINFVNVKLYSYKKNSTNRQQIGKAKAVSIVTENNIETNLYIVDLNIYSKLEYSGTASNLLPGDRIEGVTSKASAYVLTYNSNYLIVESINGEFILNENIINSRNNVTNSITTITNYKIDDVKSISNDNNSFNCNTKVEYQQLSGINFYINNNILNGINTKFKNELTSLSTIKIGDTSTEITNINDTALELVTSIPNNNNISTVYKEITKLKYKNKNLYSFIPDDYIYETVTKNIYVNKQYSVTFTNGETDVPIQNQNEIPNNNVLVMTSSGSYYAYYISATRIKLYNNVLYNGSAIISVNIQKLTPINTEKVLNNLKVLKINKTKTNITHTEYGTRIEDKEISLGVPDVKSIECIRYGNIISNTSSNYVQDLFDSVIVSSTTNINLNDYIYSKDKTVLAKVIDITNNKLTLIYKTIKKFSAEIAFNWTNNQEFNITSVNNKDYIDVTDNYKLVKNNTELVYDISKLTIINENNIPTNDLVIVYNYYTNNNLDLVTINSYDEYTSEFNNIVDFRIYVENKITGNGNITNPYLLTGSGLNPSYRNLIYRNLPFNNNIIKLDYNKYESRKDLIGIDINGSIKLYNNNDNLSSDDVLLIASLEIPGYIKNINDIVIKNIKTKRHTMMSINELENKINELNASIINLKESQNNNLGELQNRLNSYNKTKTSIFNDNIDKNNINFKESSLSIDNNTLSPYKLERNINLELDQDSNNYKVTGNVASIDYTEDKLLEQKLASNVIKVNPFNFIDWEGILTLYPHSDNWGKHEENLTYKDLSIYSNNKYINLQNRIIYIQLEGLKPKTNINILLNNKNVNNYILPSLCKIDKNGTKGNNISYIVGEQLLFYNENNKKYSLYNTSTVEDLRKYPKLLYNDDVINNNITNPYNNLPISSNYTPTYGYLHINWDVIASNILDIKDFNNTVIIGKDSGAKSLLLPTNIITDINGFWSGIIILPEDNNIKNNVLTFRAEDKDKTTFAETNFYVSGDTQTNDNKIISLKKPSINNAEIKLNIITGNKLNSINNWDSPLSQTFVNNIKNGCYITSIDLYFKNKDKNIPITIQIRTVESGNPTQTILPYSEKTLNPDKINTSNNSSIATKFTFDSLVYLKENTEYAITILTNSSNYELFTAKTNNNDILTKSKISKDPFLGSLFKSQNSYNWIPTINEDIKFIINKAIFKTNNHTVLKFKPKNLDFVKQKNAITMLTGSNLVLITAYGHGLHSNNNKVKISNVTSEYPNTLLVNGIGDIQYNINTNVIVSNASVFTQKINNSPISNSNPGYLKIEEEIIEYIAVDLINNIVTIPNNGRGKFNTSIRPHLNGSIVEPYVLNGIPLNQINTTYNNIIKKDINSFYIQTSSVANNNATSINENYIEINNQYESLLPNINFIYPKNTDITTYLTTTTNNSIDADINVESNYIQVENIPINLKNINSFSNPYTLLSNTNKNNNNKTELLIKLNSNDNNISPLIDLERCGVILFNNIINNDVTKLNNKNNGFVYVSNIIYTKEPSKYIEVSLNAVKFDNHDIIVYVKLYKDTDNSINLDYNNYIELKKIIYPSSITDTDYKEFIYQIDDLQQFSGYQIKMLLLSDTQTNYPKIKNIKSISTT